MDKYKLTAGLNYLKENSYKGDGSPGMVMGIASDARSDTNTYEGKGVNRGPTTNSKHSTERELKKYDPAHGHTKPVGGNPQVCPNCKGEGCEPCGNTGEVISKKRNDPKVDEGFPDYKMMTRGYDHNDKTCPVCKGSGNEKSYDGLNNKPGHVYIQKPKPKCPRCNGTGKKIEEGAISRQRDELIDELQSWTQSRDINEFEDWNAYLEDLRNQVPSSYYGDTAKMLEKVVWGVDDGVFDFIIANRDPDDGDVFEDIMRLAGVKEAFAWDSIEEAKRKPRHDDDDEEDEEEPEDPEKDKVQHILMQLRKAQDVDGDHPIKFLDGTKVKLPLNDINKFMQMYMNVKPQDRERLQQVAIMSKDKFYKLLTFFKPKHGKMEKSIYEDGIPFNTCPKCLNEIYSLEEAKKKGKKDACYHKVKSRYKIWPSAYASGALVKCRKVGASNWGNSSKKKKSKKK